jgi:anti-anti-sigma factor
VDEALKNGTRNIVVDLGDVTFLSSSGLRILLLLARDLRQQDGDIRLCNPKPHVAEVFHLTGFDQIFELHPNSESALASFSAG